MPIFIALSASSPFVDGVDTFFQSARLNAVSAFPLSGQCPALRDWAEFIEHFSFLQACGIARSIKDLYWDIRPKPEFGTVEIRVCDTPLTVERATALAALAQSLVHHLLRTRPVLSTQLQLYVARYNKFPVSYTHLDVYKRQIEAIRLQGRPYVVGLQWHPEFHPPGSEDLLDCTPILDEFLAAARGRFW